MINELKQLKQLNECIYELYGRLYENEELLTKKQTDYMADKLFEVYKQEYGVLALNAEPETAGEVFAAKERRRLLVPYVPGRFARIFLRRRTNAVAKLILREVREAAERAFAERTAKLDAAKKAAEQAEEQPAEQAAPETDAAAAAEQPAEQAAPETDAAAAAEQPAEPREQPPADGQPAPPQAAQNMDTAPEQGTEHEEPNGAEEHGTEADVPLIAESKPSAAQAKGRQRDVGAAG